MSLMTVGLATIAGTVMVLYATIIGQTVDGALGHILAGSILNVPSALVIAALMVPFAEHRTGGGFDPERKTASTMDAITQGTANGVMLLINVVAMLLVLVALVALVNIALGLLARLPRSAAEARAHAGLAIRAARLRDRPALGRSRGRRAAARHQDVLNELIAYIDLAGDPGAALSAKSKLILTYALCGFANLGSLGILIGGLAALVPERRAEIVALGPRSVLAGLMATCLTGAVIGLLL